MKKLFDRTQKDIEEEQMLLNELKKIEARKKERDRKTQDLQKLISQADQQGEAPQTPASSRKQDKKVNKKKVPNQVRPSRVDFVVNVSQCTENVLSQFQDSIFFRNRIFADQKITFFIKNTFRLLKVR